MTTFISLHEIAYSVQVSFTKIGQQSTTTTTTTDISQFARRHARVEYGPLVEQVHRILRDVIVLFVERDCGTSALMSRRSAQRCAYNIT